MDIQPHFTRPFWQLFVASILLNFSTVSMALDISQLPVPSPQLTWGQAPNGEAINPLSTQAPSSWDAAVSQGKTAYYIDNQSSNATDDDNPLGSPNKPRLTIPETHYAADSYIEIHGGPYDGGSQIIISAEGSPAKPIWIKGQNTEITGEMILKGHYIVVEGLLFNQATLSLRSHDNSQLSHVVVRYSTFSGDGMARGSGSGISIYGGSAEQRFHDIIIYQNEIADLGNNFSDVAPELGLSEENDYHGIHPDVNVDRVWILYNEIGYLGGDSVQVGRAHTEAENRPQHVYIAGNEFSSNLENGVDVKAADYTLIANNRIYDWRTHKDNTSTGTAIVIHNNAHQTWVVNNQISNAANGIVVSDDCRDTWLIGNVIQNISPPAWDQEWDASSLYSAGSAIHFRGGSNGGAINNTILNYAKGLENEGGQVAFVNNLLSQRNQVEGHDIHVVGDSAKQVIANNLIFDDSFPANLASHCHNCLFENPLLFNESKPAESLQNAAHKLDDAASPAIAAGSDLSMLFFDAFPQHFQLPLSAAKSGELRIQGTIDIGGYEYPNSTQQRSPRAHPVAPIINAIFTNLED